MSLDDEPRTMNAANASRSSNRGVICDPGVPGRSPHGPRILGDEDGMISLGVVVAMMLVVVLLALMLNVAHSVNEKIEIQNAADASTYGAGVWMARGMNSITTTNHTMGELMAFVVLVHSFGGEKADEPGTGHPEDNRYESVANRLLDLTYRLASRTQGRVPPSKVVFDEVREAERIASGAAILDAKVQLKFLLSAAYGVHTIGNILEKIPIPITVAIGYALEIGATVLEWKCWQEYFFLETLEETVLVPINRLKKQVIALFLPGMMSYGRVVAAQAPLGAFSAAKQLAQRNGCSGSLHPKPLLGLQLPIEQEDKAVPIARAQLMRASYPWMVYWREPILQFMRIFLTFSGAADYYLEWTHRYAEEKTDKVRRQQNLYLYVMRETRPPNPEKGYERWVHDSQRAERLFTFVGVAHREVSAVMGTKYFGGAHPHGIVCCAQAILYNSNHQNRVGGGYGWQPRVAWDTLNWDTETTHYPLYDFVRGRYRRRNGQPKVTVNWQCKLVPVTRFNEAALALEAPFGPAARQQIPDTSYLRTH